MKLGAVGRPIHELKGKIKSMVCFRRVVEMKKISEEMTKLCLTGFNQDEKKRENSKKEKRKKQNTTT